MRIRQATLEDIATIQAMADVVFRKTYAEILSPEQMEYMIHWMYSTESLTEQIAGKDKKFFIALDGDVPCGYVSVELERMQDDGTPLFHLQKIYVMPEHQGRGVGRQLFTFLVSHLQEWSPRGFRMELNVNRTNRAVGFYERMGMRRDRQGDFPIGNGFYMNDYIYVMIFG